MFSLPSTDHTLSALKKGHRYQQPLPAGSGDAWLLAHLAQHSQSPLVILCANPVDAHRLTDEIQLFAPQLKTCAFPDWETLAYDRFSPHEELISTRLSTLYALSQQAVDVLVIPVSTALYRTAPPEFLAAYSFHFKQGERLDADQLRAQLVRANYNHVDQVSAAGEFSTRGGIIDIFPMGSAVPYRLDLFDDEIESIRAFDVDTQRSIYPVNEIELLPGREFPFDEEARTTFRAQFREYFEGDPTRALPYKEVGDGIAFAGIEYYLPLFFTQTATLFDYLPTDSIIVTHGAVDDSIQDFFSDTLSRYEFLKHDPERPILAPDRLFLDSEQLFTTLQGFRRLDLRHDEAHPDFSPAPAVAVARRADDPVQALRKQIEKKEQRIILCADSLGRRETLLQMLQEHDLIPNELSDNINEALSHSAHFVLAQAYLDQGFTVNHLGLSFITENDLYPHQARVRTRGRREQRTDLESMIRDLSELRIGDPVVHQEHGIGRYQGLIEMDLGEGPVELLHLEYAEQATLYVPVAQLHVISRYTGADHDSAPLHLLGSGQWEKARRRAAKQARDTAAELLALYAQRAARSGQTFKVPMQDYEVFCDGFGFEPTPDQQAAIEAVIHDMQSSQPMDRLVCGDVGFGKTEIALRAAFIAVANGFQVAILCPTTLLAEQHTQTFADRFAEWPVTIGELSRFKTAKESRATIEGLQEGRIDIVIGTHALLSKNVKFKRLGLLIIDEEHRFGVRQKERLKALRSEVDVLTLTATPIPRTLGMSLEGIRDLSVIATAPQRRLAVKTFVRREDSSIIREALLRELKRGGQAYFLHNEVETIFNRRDRLEELLPEARIAVAHGQMPERELERVMRDFYQRRYNVLLCTTIIETGLDVPTANTIVIHRADRLGLAQLHQLRGRVGRSHHQAYAYLLTPDEEAITPQAHKRLEAIEQMDTLGAGFFLAMNDLEIRGAGEVLGDQQSGNIHDVGFSMYNDMLNAALKSLRDGEHSDDELLSTFDQHSEINLRAPALLPSDYCADINARLGFYKQLAHAKDEERINETQEELIDRYGPLPDNAHHLLHLHRLRLRAEELGITSLDVQEEQMLIQFDAHPKVDPVQLIELVQTRRNVRFDGPEKLRVTYKAPLNVTERFHYARRFLAELRVETPAAT
ncbi:MAG TPA: transcription-repair coupling factor [Paenalcaligenes sp.]|nr:transcription-repair coupling factor [Paenalcaligenes sp.]